MNGGDGSAAHSEHKPAIIEPDEKDDQEKSVAVV